jgi:hypothetical protein
MNYGYLFLLTLDDLGMIGSSGRPDWQVKVFRRQDAPNHQEALTGNQFIQCLSKLMMDAVLLLAAEGWYPTSSGCDGWPSRERLALPADISIT